MEARMTTSNWGSRNDLDDVLALAPAGKLVHRVERHPLEDINDVFERLASGKVGGRAVLTP
jgi:propanol-preferring alcohol dehydrogenase